MPYIKEEDRRQLDLYIDGLAEAIVRRAKGNGDAAYAGLLNYSCTRLALRVIFLQFGKLRYWLIATTVGVFHNVADEFYRRLTGPYEDIQIEKNGDVDMITTFLIEMGDGCK